MYRLMLQNRDAGRAPFTGADATVVVGRDPSCGLQLTDGGVSDRHASIERRADGYYVRDLGSANGVRVNGQRVTEQRLAGGDEIELGAARLKFEFVHELATGRRVFDPLYAVAVGIVTVLVAGQVTLFGWILSRDHPRRGRTDIATKAAKQQARELTNDAPRELPPLPATEAVDVPAGAAPMLNHMLKIARADRSDAAAGVTLRLQIKAQVGERQLNAGNVAIGVQFFTAPATPTKVIWLAVPADWENFSSRTLTAKFTGPCAGYVVRTFYRKQLQDVLATPASLATAKPWSP